jgi:hypothetical protein
MDCVVSRRLERRRCRLTAVREAVDRMISSARVSPMRMLRLYSTPWLVPSKREARFGWTLSDGLVDCSM